MSITIQNIYHIAGSLSAHIQRCMGGSGASVPGVDRNCLSAVIAIRNRPRVRMEIGRYAGAAGAEMRCHKDLPLFGIA